MNIAAVTKTETEKEYKWSLLVYDLSNAGLESPDALRSDEPQAEIVPLFLAYELPRRGVGWPCVWDIEESGDDEIRILLCDENWDTAEV